MVEVETQTMLNKKPVRSKRMQEEARIGWIFLSPWIIGFVLLKAFPILVALIVSFTDFQMLTPEATRFIGVANYVEFMGDAEAGANLVGSLTYFLLSVTLELVVALRCWRLSSQVIE